LKAPGEPKTTLHDVQCQGRRTILRVQAEKPGSSAKYHLFVRSGPNRGVPQLEAPMVQDCIDFWVSTKKGTFDFKKVTTSEWNANDGGLEKNRQYTSRAQTTSFSRSTKSVSACARAPYCLLICSADRISPVASPVLT